MIRIVLSLVIAGSCVTATATEKNQNGFYIGAKTIRAKLTGSSSEPTLSYNLLGANAGYRLNRHLAIEGQFLINNKAEPFEDATVAIKRYSGVNMIAQLPLNNAISAYATVGYGRVQAESVYADEKITGHESGASYGAGLQIDIDRATLRAGFEHMMKVEDMKIEGWSLNALYRF